MSNSDFTEVVVLRYRFFIVCRVAVYLIILQNTTATLYHHPKDDYICSMKKTLHHHTEIRVYQSLWKNLLLATISIAFAFVGVLMLQDVHIDMSKRLIAGWGGIIFFGGCGILIFFGTLYNRIRHIPLLIIYDDRVCMYVQLKGTYQTIMFSDVKRFCLKKYKSTQLITIDYKAKPMRQKMEKSSWLKNSVMALNLKVAGSIEGIPCDNLTMKGNALYELLNKRLQNAHKRAKAGVQEE